jgi:hypothetical protein
MSIRHTSTITNPPAGTKTSTRPWWYQLKYLLAGWWFGIVLVKSEVMSWFRIQEMFRLQSFHLYGVLGSAVITGIISVWLIKKLRVRTVEGEPVVIPPKNFIRELSMADYCLVLAGH